MLTTRGWWLLASALSLTVLGLVLRQGVLAWLGLTLLLWLGSEWLFFLLRLARLRSSLTLQRTFADERGPVQTLWVGRSFTVCVRLSLRSGRVPFVLVCDPVAFAVRHRDGETFADGPLGATQPFEIRYRIECPRAGMARFEGVRVELTDYQGLFARWFFARQPVEVPILPAVVAPRRSTSLHKRCNALPPPGTHRLAKPGSGSELLDLRDYQPGDPPRTIAWKVSARREKLITREFESEVPVRSVLFVDVSSAVLLPSPCAEAPELLSRPVDRLIELAAALFRANTSRRDLSGLCLVDEEKTRVLRPARGRAHLNNLLRLLGQAAALGPRACRADPELLLPVAHSLAQEIYPERLEARLNKVPFWLTWWIGGPLQPRHSHGIIDWLHRHKRSLLLGATMWIPLAVLVVHVVAAFTDAVPAWARMTLGALSVLGLPLLVLLAWLLFALTLLFSGSRRKLFRWRKRLAALLAHKHGLPAGGVEYLLQDDDALSEHLQRFLTSHHVPYTVPLYDQRGRPLHTDPRKITRLAQALLTTASHGQDNELYVLLVDLLEDQENLLPLLSAIKVARARHHQVMVVQPWPRGVPLPDRPLPEPSNSLLDQLRKHYYQQMHAAFGRLRRSLAGLGVAVLCAEADEVEQLLLERMERLRRVGGRR